MASSTTSTSLASCWQFVAFELARDGANACLRVEIGDAFCGGRHLGAVDGVFGKWTIWRCRLEASTTS